MFDATAYLISVADEFTQAALLLDNSNLGASPAELDYNIEQERPKNWADHEACPELRLWDHRSISEK